MNDTKAWYESRGVWGGVIALIAAVVAPLMGLTLDAALQGEVVDIVVGVGGVVGAALATYGRIKATSTIGSE